MDIFSGSFYQTISLLRRGLVQVQIVDSTFVIGAFSDGNTGTWIVDVDGSRVGFLFQIDIETDIILGESDHFSSVQGHNVITDGFNIFHQKVHVVNPQITKITK